MRQHLGQAEGCCGAQMEAGDPQALAFKFWWIVRPFLSSPEANAFRSVLSHGFKPTAVEGVAIKGKMGHKPARTGYCVSSNYFHPLRSFERAATAILADSWKLLTFPPGCWQLAIGSKMGPYFMSSGNAAFKNCRKKWSVLPATSHCPFAKCWQYCCHAVASPSLASGSKKKNNDQCPMH